MASSSGDQSVGEDEGVQRGKTEAEMAEAMQQAAAAAQEAQSAHPLQSKRKSWLTRGLAGLMNLPNHTPMAVLRLTTPAGPMPVIVHLPSRDVGRTIAVYVWIPPSDAHHHNHFLGFRHATTAKEQDDATFRGDERPCLIDFHGGSFYMGGPLEEAPWCAAIARSGIIAITVVYRQGPEWEFPAALLDAEDVVRAVLHAQSDAGIVLRNELAKHSQERIRSPDPKRVAVSGFSSGGNIALNTVLSIPAQLNTANAGLESDEKSERKGDEDAADNAIYHNDKGDWPSPFVDTTAKTIPTLLFFPSLDARQPEFERQRPEGMPPPGEVSKWVGRTMVNAYLPAELVGHLRASPGLAPVGMKGGVEQELLVRREAAKRHGVPMDTDDSVLTTDDDDHHLAVRGSLATREATLDCMHPATRAILVLPQLDSLSQQSEVWVEALDAADKLITSPEEDGSMIGQPLRDQPTACVRVHRIVGVHHGFTTIPDAFLDERSRPVKHTVMEQARQHVVNMFL